MKILNAEKNQLINWLKIHNDYENVCNSCTEYIALFVIAFLIIIGINGVFIYFHWYLKKSNTNITNINPGTETIIY